MRRIEHLPGKANVVTNPVCVSDKLFEEGAVRPESESLHILENEILRLELLHDPQELADQAIARVVQKALANQGEALTRRAAEHYMDGPGSNAGRKPNFLPGQANHRPRQDCAMREVKLVDRAVDGVDLDRCRNIEPRLFEAQAHTSRSGKKVDSDRPLVHARSFAELYP
jgi:hypothetical protein